MYSDAFMWVGFGLSFVAAFLYSLFKVALDASSRISLSRILEDRDKDFRVRILDIYDELTLSPAAAVAPLAVPLPDRRVPGFL
jgi:hypothetical protein